jgi:hypothetical protein
MMLTILFASLFVGCLARRRSFGSALLYVFDIASDIDSVPTTQDNAYNSDKLFF